jgi:hypothetical protein
MSNWAVKRAEHRNPPKLAKPADEVITILAA